MSSARKYEYKYADPRNWLASGLYVMNPPYTTMYVMTARLNAWFRGSVYPFTFSHDSLMYKSRADGTGTIFSSQVVDR